MIQLSELTDMPCPKCMQGILRISFTLNPEAPSGDGRLVCTLTCDSTNVYPDKSGITSSCGAIYLFNKPTNKFVGGGLNIQSWKVQLNGSNQPAT